MFNLKHLGWLICCTLACAALIAMAADAPREGQEALPLKLPKPNRIRTPRDIPPGVGKMEKPSTRPAFLAPAGCVNLAANRPVTSSDPDPLIGKMEQITDGDKNAIEGSWVELGPDKQWVQIDLGASPAIHAIIVWHRHETEIVYKGVVVQVSDDPKFAAGVTTVFNNDQDNSVGLGAGKDLYYFDDFQGKLIDTKGVKARYVRLWSKGNTVDDQNHYTEVEVWGLAK